MIYIDSSALAKLVLDEKESPALDDFLASKPVRVSSALTTVEMRRAVSRRAPTKLVDAQRVLGGLTLMPIDPAILHTAVLLEPAALRTLDAIHLASALVIRDELEAFVAYDDQLLEAATRLGIPTASPGLEP